ncbi:MAG TPA: cyclic nucleotide-binding domain-containing protein [Actinomycetota bacterium]
MPKEPIQPLAGVVPSVIATAGVRERSRAQEPRSDRPLGRRGVELLADVPLFAGLSKRHLKQIAEHADQVSFRAKEVIVETGSRGGTFYVLLEGEARVVRNGRAIGRLGPGEFFGEISLLDGGPRTATVIAETPVVAVRVFKRSFDKVVSQEPGVASKILEVVARRLRDAERRSLST